MDYGTNQSVFSFFFKKDYFNIHPKDYSTMEDQMTLIIIVNGSREFLRFMRKVKLAIPKESRYV